MPTDPPTPQTDHDLDYGPTLRGLREGLKAFQRYTLQRKLGQGGMGVVWLAHDERLDLEVALKFLPENLAHDEAALDDLRRETRRCMKLNHPHIVRVYDLVEGGENDTAAIAMEYVEGKSLTGLRLERPNRVFEVADIETWVRQVCEALEYAHTEGKVVHRDLKPANLMVDARGNMRVMDFGIASSLGDSMSRLSKASQARSGGGTLPYMSPQQLMGYPPSVSDDVYSLGATIYELLTGKPPFFRGGDIGISRQIETQMPPSMTERRKELEVEDATEIPAAWESVVTACLEKEDQARLKKITQVWQRLYKKILTPLSESVRTPISRAASSPLNVEAAKMDAIPPPHKGSSKTLDYTPVTLILALVVIAAGWWFGFEAPHRAEIADKAKKIARAPEAIPLITEKIDTKAPVVAQKKEPIGEMLKMTPEETNGNQLIKQPDVKNTMMTSDLNAAKIGDTRMVDLGNGSKMIFCYIPQGIFTMGSPKTEAGRSSDEYQKQVNISHGFWLAKTECTQEQWRAVMGNNPSNFKGDDLPVEMVGTEDIQIFMSKLNNTNALPPGWKWSLPNNEQWEYACRAGTTTAFSYGDNLDLTQANFNSDIPKGNRTEETYLKKTSPAGNYPSNAWGLQDMHGNVCELCTAPKARYAYGGGYENRGGSWYDPINFCRSAYSDSKRLGFTRYLGFRAALMPLGTE